MNPLARLSPGLRKLLAAAIAVGGVFVVGNSLHGVVPRTVEVRVPLGSIVRAGYTPRAVEVSMARGSENLRSMERRFGTSVPSEMVATMELPEGALQAHVEVSLDDRVLVRDETVVVQAGMPLEIPCPEVPVDPRNEAP